MMSVSTSTAQHAMHGSISYTQNHSPEFGHGYEDDELSPTSTYFPTQTVPKPASPGPLPNPPFVFPARPSPSSAPPSISRGNRRGLAPPTLEQINRAPENMADTRDNIRNRPPPLPSFSFGSGSPLKSTSPHSPISPPSPSMSIPTRPGGHRRGGSEFIGGDGTTGNGTLLSSSPGNGEAELPTPSSVGPPAGRRGHAHRRSAAISCHDLSMMLKPPVGSSSAPTSPSDVEYKRSSFPTTLDATVNSKSRVSQPPSPERLSNRARVGFSDTLEFIPRPLSLATSESSSNATARPGHSVSGSLSSIVSTNNGSLSSRDIQRYPSPPLLDRSQNVRPRTAGAILGGTAKNLSSDAESTQPQQLNQVDASPEKPTTPTTPRFPGKKFMFFDHKSASGEQSPTISRPGSSDSANRPAATAEPLPSPPKASANIGDAANVSSSSGRPRRTSITKKPKKVKKSWSILPHKTRSRSSSLKQQKALSRRSPTPPLRHYQPPDDESSSTGPAIEVDAPALPPRPQLQTDIASWRPRQVVVQDEDSMSPIIDLDAALGPFNTPTGRDLEWEASQRGSSLRKRRMHSAAGIGGFATPYHRRAESAPQMAAFENSRMSIHHLGSSSTMADVFEEDEEDDEWEETKSVSHKGSKSDLDEEEDCSNPNVRVVDAVDMHEGKSMDWAVEEEGFAQRGIKRKGSGLSESERREINSSLSSENTVSSLNEPIQEGLEVLGTQIDMSPPSPDSGDKFSDSTMTPQLRPNAAKNLAPVEVGSFMLHERYLTPSSIPSEDPSPFPSPRSPFSYDAQRISTAPSSLAEDRSFHSLLLGEPGPELRMSVDEVQVPSLTSSSSTMTGTFSFPPANVAPFADGTPQFRDGQRSASLSAAAVSRKRSSIVSLSRLMHTSHGEKSKLSIETQAPSSPDKKEKSSRSKRLSRRLQFWKPKDAAPS